MFSKKIVSLLVVAIPLGLGAACAGLTQPQVVTVVETVIAEKEVEGQTVTVVKPVEVVKEAAPEEPEAGQIRLDIVVGTDPPSLDPSLAIDTTSIFFIRQMFVGLGTFDEKANVVPYLATEWVVSDDGLEWTFNLRDDIH